MGGQQVMCFREWVVLVEICFWTNRKIFSGRWIVSGENMKFPVPAKNESWIYSKAFTNLHQFSFSTATKIMCSFSFSLLLAVSSPYCNFDFSQNRILRSYCNCPFAPVQNMAVRICGTNKLLQKNLMHWTFQILSIIPPHGFWTEVAERSPVCFWVLFAEAKRT